MQNRCKTNLVLLCTYCEPVRSVLCGPIIFQECFDMPAARKPNDPIALQVRMTEGLRRKLANAAEKNGRSLNSEILWRLGRTLDEQSQRLISGIEEREKMNRNFWSGCKTTRRFKRR